VGSVVVIRQEDDELQRYHVVLHPFIVFSLVLSSQLNQNNLAKGRLTACCHWRPDNIESVTKVWLTTEADCKSSLHSFITLMGVTSDHTIGTAKECGCSVDIQNVLHASFSNMIFTRSLRRRQDGDGQDRETDISRIFIHIY